MNDGMYLLRQIENLTSSALTGVAIVMEWKCGNLDYTTIPPAPFQQTLPFPTPRRLLEN